MSKSFILLVPLFAALTACSTFQATDDGVCKRCMESRILMTDLTQPVESRHYLLPDKTVCPSGVLLGD